MSSYSLVYSIEEQTELRMWPSGASQAHGIDTYAPD